MVLLQRLLGWRLILRPHIECQEREHPIRLAYENDSSISKATKRKRKVSFEQVEMSTHIELLHLQLHISNPEAEVG